MGATGMEVALRITEAGKEDVATGMVVHGMARRGMITTISTISTTIITSITISWVSVSVWADGPDTTPMDTATVDAPGSIAVRSLPVVPIGGTAITRASITTDRRESLAAPEVLSSFD